MRTKKGKSLAAAELKTAWAEYYASNREEKLSDYEAEGWKTLATIAEESSQSVPTVTSQMKALTAKKVFEKKIIRSRCSNGVREVAIFRPVCQRRANSHAKH